MTKHDINIDGTCYISVEKHLEELNEIKTKLDSLTLSKTEKKKIRRFDEKKYVKIIRLMSKLFSIQTETINEEYIMNNEVIVLDPANVCMVQAKTEEAKALLVLFKDFETEKNSPVLDYVSNGIQKSRFSQDYLIKILDILCASDDEIIQTSGVVITMKTDFPITLENTHFKFVLAPRITED